MPFRIATSLQNQTIGFTGLGLMGKSMARNLD
jgi:prephenate dehydrogenase